ncbi:MAG: YfhO family protein [Tannerella sp.]|nr:YfhO family protein [Tannerella sp.]
MKEILKKILPHIAAIVLFFVLSVIYFYPVAFEDKALFQGDLSNMVGWGKDLKDYHRETGDYAFWSNSMFSGMPANYTYMAPFFNIFNYIRTIFRLNLPGAHIGILFIYMFGFYIFLTSLGCKPLLSIVGAIAYAFTSYNLIIIAVGHVNKGLVMATMAPILGGIILCYRKKYLVGSFITLIFMGIHAASSHHQISYYLLLVIIILAIVYFIYAVKKNTLKEYFKSSAILLVAASFAIAPELGNLISTADYSKDTMRGGSELKKNEEKKGASGLDIDYAFGWSYGKGETMNLLIPNFYGASSHYKLGEDSECYKVLRSTGQAKQFCRNAPMYWGEQPFTDGPAYIGAIVCFLFAIGIFIVKGPEKWWLLGATVFAIVLAWGKNFEIVNTFLFYHLPLYNKFRVPAMALTITEVTMATMAILALKEIFDNKGNRKIYLKPVYLSAGITGGLCLIFALFGSSLMSFSGLSDEPYRNYPGLLDAIVADRKSLLSSDSWRSFFFIAAAAGLLWYYINKKFQTTYLVAIIGILIFIDLWNVDKRFLNDDNFVDKKRISEVIPTEIDQEILKDKDPNYRVLNLTTNTFQESKTSYFHKSIGGYSPVKLSRYQDIIDNYFAGNIHPPVINMLNTKYIIFPTQQGPQLQKNTAALGNVWFVNNLQWVNSPNEEIAALKDFDPAQTAFVDKEWQSKLEEWETLQHAGDSTAFIRLTNYANPGNLFYESSSAVPHLAVFSEVFYKTWRAYIDGKETSPVRVNYILRGLKVPAGQHKIEFKCVDEVFLRGAKISKISSIIVGIVILCLLSFMIWSSLKNKPALSDKSI